MLLHALASLSTMLLFGAFTYLLARTFGQRYITAKSTHRGTAAAILVVGLLALTAATRLALNCNENYLLLIPGFMWLVSGYLAVPEPEEGTEEKPKRRVRSWAFFD